MTSIEQLAAASGYIFWLLVLSAAIIWAFVAIIEAKDRWGK